MLLYVWFIAGEKRGKYSCELWSVIALIFMDSLWTCCVCGLSKCKEIFSRKIDILFLVTFIHFIPWFFRQNFQKTVHGFVCSYLSFFIPLAQLHEYFIYNKQSVHSSHLRSSLLYASSWGWKLPSFEEQYITHAIKTMRSYSLRCYSLRSLKFVS